MDAQDRVKVPDRTFPWQSTKKGVLRLLPNRKGQSTLLTMTRPFIKSTRALDAPQSDTACSVLEAQALDDRQEPRKRPRGDSSDSDESLHIIEPACHQQISSGQLTSSIDAQQFFPSSPPLQQYAHQASESEQATTNISQWTNEADLYLLKMVVLRQAAPKLYGVNLARVAQRLVTEGLLKDVTPLGVQ